MDDNIFSIGIQDIQNEALNTMGRYLTDAELEKAIKLLQYGLGENLIFMYHNLFSEIQNG